MSDNEAAARQLIPFATRYADVVNLPPIRYFTAWLVMMAWVALLLLSLASEPTVAGYSVSFLQVVSLAVLPVTALTVAVGKVARIRAARPVQYLSVWGAVLLFGYILFSALGNVQHSDGMIALAVIWTGVMACLLIPVAVRLGPPQESVRVASLARIRVDRRWSVLWLLANPGTRFAVAMVLAYEWIATATLGMSFIADSARLSSGLVWLSLPGYTVFLAGVLAIPTVVLARPMSQPWLVPLQRFGLWAMAVANTGFGVWTLFSMSLDRADSIAGVSVTATVPTCLVVWRVVRSIELAGGGDLSLKTEAVPFGRYGKIFFFASCGLAVVLLCISLLALV